MVVVTAAILFLVFVVAIGTAVVKAYEWRQDVLYGPYIGRRSKRNQATDRSF
jgi:putative copper export protein